MMSSWESTPANRHLLPEGALRCVWMTAGLVAYRLCDRELECDDCQFDMVMRGQPPAGLPVAKQAVSGTVPLSQEWNFPEDRRYHPAHMWAKAMNSDRVRIGLDWFAAKLIGPISSIVLQPRGSLVRQGRVGCWVICEAGSISLLMPVTGIVRSSGSRLRSQAALAATFPYHDGWLLEVSCEEPERELGALMPAADMQVRAQEQWEKLNKQASDYLEKSRAPVGLTLADGGQSVGDLRKMLGPQAYLHLIGRYFV